MKFNSLPTLSLALIVALGPLVPRTPAADDPDDTAVMTELKRREENAGNLRVEEQLIIRAAQQKAMDDPEVKVALQKRDQVLVEFREKLRAAMIAADPKVKPILEKITQGGDPNLNMGN